MFAGSKNDSSIEVRDCVEKEVLVAASSKEIRADLGWYDLMNARMWMGNVYAERLEALRGGGDLIT